VHLDGGGLASDLLWLDLLSFDFPLHFRQLVSFIFLLFGLLLPLPSLLFVETLRKFEASQFTFRLLSILISQIVEWTNRIRKSNNKE
jgi:hypothetical protein